MLHDLTEVRQKVWVQLHCRLGGSLNRHDFLAACRRMLSRFFPVGPCSASGAKFALACVSRNPKDVLN